jgi:hypothetical protein
MKANINYNQLIFPNQSFDCMQRSKGVGLANKNNNDVCAQQSSSE